MGVFSGMTPIQRSRRCCVYFLTTKNAPHDETRGRASSQGQRSRITRIWELLSLPLSLTWWERFAHICRTCSRGFIVPKSYVRCNDCQETGIGNIFWITELTMFWFFFFLLDIFNACYASLWVQRGGDILKVCSQSSDCISPLLMSPPPVSQASFPPSVWFMWVASWPCFLWVAEPYLSGL